MRRDKSGVMWRPESDLKYVQTMHAIRRKRRTKDVCPCCANYFVASGGLLPVQNICLLHWGVSEEGRVESGCLRRDSMAVQLFNECVLRCESDRIFRDRGTELFVVDPYRYR